jgi:hypothetical protein
LRALIRLNFVGRTGSVRRYCTIISSRLTVVKVRRIPIRLMPSPGAAASCTDTASGFMAAGAAVVSERYEIGPRSKRSKLQHDCDPLL